ncbi:MAG: methionyl-tRNA formyltransferase [Candidatus Coatesbacteria bacterium]|nr:methionyl-tRNA formyltransferase [Candidatus Coatesbacteria bacterium]
MELVFWGTSEFCIPTLKALFEDSFFRIKAIITHPDTICNRGYKSHSCPVKKFGIDHNIRILEPSKPSSKLFIEQNIEHLAVDAYVVISYGYILKKRLLDIPKLGAINLHPSLLPKYRGPAPISWALINGEKKTGLTTFILNDKVDSGEILLQKEVDIFQDETYGELEARLSFLGSKYVVESLKRLIDGSITPQKQDDSLVSFAPKIDKQMVKIDWNKTSNNIFNFIRGLSPKYKPFTYMEDKRINIYKVLKTDLDISLFPGECRVIARQLYIGTSDKPLEIMTLQIESKKILPSSEFLKGYPNISGKVLR